MHPEVPTQSDASSSSIPTSPVAGPGSSSSKNSHHTSFSSSQLLSPAVSSEESSLGNSSFSSPMKGDTSPASDTSDSTSSSCFTSFPTHFIWRKCEAGPGPATRGRHTAGIDERRGQMIIFGGQNYDLKKKYNNIARFDLKSEKWITTDEEYDVSPCARSSHSSVTTSDALIVFGGATGVSFLSSPGCCKDASTWKFSHTTNRWSRLEVEELDQVCSRYGHTTVLTPGNKVYLFGGMTNNGCDSNTYLIDLEKNTVKKLECTYVGSAGDVCGPAPDNTATPVSAASSTSTPSHPTSPPEASSSYTYLQPTVGQTAVALESSPLVNTQDTPAQQKRTAQEVRDCVRGFGHTAIYNKHTHSMYVLGGTIDGRKYHNAFLRLDLKTNQWQIEDSVNSPPVGRYVHCASFDELHNSMYVFGGFCGQYKNDIHQYNFNTKRWEEVFPHPSFGDGPSLRSGACSVIWKDHLYVFGGCDDAKYYNDVWKLRLWNDTVSLQDTILNHLAWQEARDGTSIVSPIHIPARLYRTLVEKREEFRQAQRGRRLRLSTGPEHVR